MKTFHVILFCFLSIDLWCQQIPPELIPNLIDNTECLGNDSSIIQHVVNNGSCYTFSIYNRSYDYKFIPSSTQPTLYVRTNFIFLQRQDGTGNFEESNMEHQTIINELITSINTTFSNMTNPNSQSCYTGTDFVPDSKIQFIVNKVYVRDDYGWNNRHDNRNRYMCPDYTDWYLNYLDNQIVANENIPKGINIYFTEDSVNYRNLIELQNTTSNYGAGYACSQFPSTYNFERTSKIHEPDVFSKYWYMKNIIPGVYNQPWDPVVKSWEIEGTARGIAHEIGHSLMLFHESPYYNNGTCYYSLMNPAGAAPHNYLPPTEIGRLFAALSLTNLRSFVPNETFLGVKQISSIETWHNMRLYHSLNVTPSGQMTFPCDITMPYQSNIEVNGKLFINNSNIHSIQNDWGGIIVKSGGLLVINETTLSDYNILVESGGSIIIKGSLTISGNHNISIQNGGFICIESGTSINLDDYNSLIKINDGALIGINPSLSLQSNCITSPTTYSFIGNGSIVDYSQDVYIQNTTINVNRFFGGKNIYVGNHVTNLQTGDVIINNGANVVFDCKEITFETGFECVGGSTYEVKNH